LAEEYLELSMQRSTEGAASMQKDSATDYQTYHEIMDELLRPITAEGLDSDTLKRLYESKLVYLENLRTKCFVELNGEKPGRFSMEDYKLILEARRETQRHLRDLILVAMAENLAKRDAVLRQTSISP
jgi:hypothetical protein